VHWRVVPVVRPFACVGDWVGTWVQRWMDSACVLRVWGAHGIALRILATRLPRAVRVALLASGHALVGRAFA
jgi:hypothetical protein